MTLDPKRFQPMLSAKLPTDTPDVLMAALKKLQYPLFGSPKVDGIRVVVHPELGAVTRKLKPVPNKYIRSVLESLHGMDGEITAGPVTQMTTNDIFNHSQSFTMTQHELDSSPEVFTFSVFDDVTSPSLRYGERLVGIRARLGDADLLSPLGALVRRHDFAVLENPEDVLAYEDVCLREGYEGIMVRSPIAGYKYGRSTLKQQHLIKLKRMADGEAVVIGFEPMRKNANELTKDELGYAKRSAEKDGMVEMPMLGALVVRMDDMEFNVGSGFDHEQRADLWDKREELKGKVITFKYQAQGMKDVPRFPIFKGFRSD